MLRSRFEPPKLTVVIDKSAHTRSLIEGSGQFVVQLPTVEQLDLAQALGTPTVGLYWVGNLINAGPLGRSLHRAHLSWATRCPECGADLTQVGWTAARCAHDMSLLTDISPLDVHGDVRQFTATSPLAPGR